MDKRLTFNEDPEAYEKWRPRYVGGLFEEIFAYAKLAAGSIAIEVGIGTGQATEPFLKAGCRITAIELGEELARYSARKFARYPHLRIVRQAFEDYAGPSGETDLLYSGTAFHWIPEPLGYDKAHALLKPGGTLALFWNHAAISPANLALKQAVDEVYRDHFPKPSKPIETLSEHSERIGLGIERAGFADYRLKLFHSERQFGVEEYVGLLQTYSDHRHLPPEAKRPFEAGLREAIHAHGGTVIVRDTIDLHLGRKPS